MDYEQKYKEALERAKHVHTTNVDENKKSTEYIFPELQESEDERIRKGLIKALSSIGKRNWGGIDVFESISWLEKQGEQKPTVVDFKAKDWYVSKVDGKIHNMYYSVDKVEPKFKIGDWVVLTAGELSITLQIVNVDINKKLYWFNDDSYLPIGDEECLHEECLHLWTIQDAKDGDVLAFIDNIGGVIICKSPTSYDTRSFCRVAFDIFRPYEESGWDSTLLRPATLTQQNLLFRKMKEAGYEWDTKKKELKKIEPKKLDPDKVIEWIHKYWPFSWGNFTLQVDDAIDKFKKDFGLWNDKMN